MTSIKTEATNGLEINQVNTCSSKQIILTKFAVTVTLTYFIFKHFKSRRVFNFCRHHAPTFDAKYLTEFKPNFVVLKVCNEKVCLLS